jgi:hypothetical protein
MKNYSARQGPTTTTETWSLALFLKPVAVEPGSALAGSGKNVGSQLCLSVDLPNRQLDPTADESPAQTLVRNPTSACRALGRSYDALQRYLQ